MKVTGCAEDHPSVADTLVRLRWLAIGGQVGAVVFVAFILGFPLPIGGPRDAQP